MAAVVVAFVLAAGCSSCTKRMESPVWRFDVGVSGADSLDGSLDVPPPRWGDTSGDCTVRHPTTSHIPKLVMEATADDFLEVWVDGRQIGTSSQWKQVLDVQVDVANGRSHVVAVRAEDRNQVISGFIAALEIHSDTPSCMQTGRNTAWRVTTSSPPQGWRSVGFDDSHWETPNVASNDCQNTWSSAVDLPRSEWVWQANCDVGQQGWHEQNWYRLEFRIEPPN